jgi:hypothetical protein
VELSDGSGSVNGNEAVAVWTETAIQRHAMAVVSIVHSGTSVAFAALLDVWR